MKRVTRSQRVRVEVAKRVKIEDSTTIEPRIKVEIENTSDLGPTAVKYEPEPIASNANNMPTAVKKEEPLATPPNFFKFATPGIKEKGTLEPSNWRDIYNEIVVMRSKFMAPVDSQGCERMPETVNPGVKKTNPRIFRFQLLVSLMLSSQTKDEVNFDAMTALHQGLLSRGYSDGLALESVLDLSEKEIDSYICKVGFHNRKSVYIKSTCEILRDKFEGDIPKTIEDIVSLPGVGPKMGYLLLQNAWNINTGIGVDVHLHRLADMWKWTKNAKTPEHTRLQLEAWLPKEYWADINPLMVGFGQAICVPRANNCDICTLAAKGLCSAANKKLLKGPPSEQRLQQLRRQRADLSQLLDELY